MAQPKGQHFRNVSGRFGSAARRIDPRDVRSLESLQALAGSPRHAVVSGQITTGSAQGHRKKPKLAYNK